jgi:IMP dehydrogenase
MSLNPPRTYTYSDIGLVPREFSQIRSRGDVETTDDFCGVLMDLPVLLAPMETVVGAESAKSAFINGMMAVLPRRPADTDKDLNDFEDVVIRNELIAIPSVPATGKDFEYLVNAYLGLETWAMCIDVANGFHVAVGEAVDYIRKLNEDIYLVTGNIASVEAYDWCASTGIDAIRVGIGGGSVCSTSIATGVGVGQASLVREIAERKEGYYNNGPLIIADGGIKTPGDIAKAIALGADIVMVGGMFAGTEEAPGAIVEQNGIRYKELAGQASMEIKRNGNYVEGVKTLVPCKGPIKNIAKEIEDGLRSAMAYMNCETLDQLRFLPDECFVGLSNEAKRERRPHANI